MRKFLYLIGIISLFSACNNDQYTRGRVVRIDGVGGAMCSGEQVRAPSGADYILTAAHCKGLAKDGLMKITTEDHKVLYRRIIDEDRNSDLLLVEGVPHLEGLHIAKHAYKGERIKTFTHGARMDTYETDGELVHRKLIQAQAAVLTDAAQKCEDMPKYKTFEFFGQTSCILSVYENVTTALIVPGSSGGMAVNLKGELVGVVSAGDGTFGYLVTRTDIVEFLGNY